jgi:alpha-D-ribose 1-methylphosphonate 5-triphosphate diphosphatase
MYILTNGSIVTEDAVLTGFDLVVEGDSILALVPTGRMQEGSFFAQEVRLIDAMGGYILPGLVDIHADYIERMAAPRPTSIMDFSLSLRESERELATHGITTMFHSLSFYAFTEFEKSPIRTPENTKRFIELIDGIKKAAHLIRHRFHARFEIDNLGRVDELVDYIKTGKIHLVSFMDHTPGQGQYRDLEIYRKTLKGYRNVSDTEIAGIIETSQNREKLTAEGIREIAELAASNRIAIASHDDDSVEKLELVRSFGVDISEFPTTMEVARAARKAGMHVVAGAPNVLLGGSHSGNLSAAEAILDGSVDILCSDYYPASMLHAVFLLHREHGLPLADMARLVSLNPARAVGMDGEIGSITVGKKADLLVVRLLDGNYPVVSTAMVNGTVILSTGYREGAA